MLVGPVTAFPVQAVRASQTNSAVSQIIVIIIVVIIIIIILIIIIAVSSIWRYFTDKGETTALRRSIK